MVVMYDSKFKFISMVKLKHLTLDCEIVGFLKIIFVCETVCLVYGE